jgi:hypothetical protein
MKQQWLKKERECSDLNDTWENKLDFTEEVNNDKLICNTEARRWRETVVYKFLDRRSLTLPR